MRFSGKDCEHVMRIKKDLKDLNTAGLGFLEGKRLFTNNSLCLYYMGLWNEWKKKNNGLIKKSFRFLLLMVQFG